MSQHSKMLLILFHNLETLASTITTQNVSWQIVVYMLTCIYANIFIILLKNIFHLKMFADPSSFSLLSPRYFFAFLLL